MATARMGGGGAVKFANQESSHKLCGVFLFEERNYLNSKICKSDTFYAFFVMFSIFKAFEANLVYAEFLSHTMYSSTVICFCIA